VLIQLLGDFCIYRTTTLEDMYSFGGDTNISKRQLAHVGIIFPDGLFTSDYVCLKVDRWMKVSSHNYGLIERHEMEDPYFAL
jgi:hypothetical protein